MNGEGSFDCDGDSGPVFRYDVSPPAMEFTALRRCRISIDFRDRIPISCFFGEGETKYVNRGGKRTSKTNIQILFNSVGLVVCLGPFRVAQSISPLKNA